MPIGLVIPDPSAAARPAVPPRPAPSFQRLRTAVGPMGGSPFGPVPVLGRKQPLPEPTSPGEPASQQQRQQQRPTEPESATAEGGSAAMPPAARSSESLTHGPQLPARAAPARAATGSEQASQRPGGPAAGRRRSGDPSALPATTASAPSPGVHVEDPTSPGAPGTEEHARAVAAAAEEAEGDRQQRLLDHLWPLVRCMVGVAFVPLLQGGTPAPGPGSRRGAAARARVGESAGQSSGGTGGRRARAQASGGARGRSTSGGRVAATEAARGAAAAAAMLRAAAAPASVEDVAGQAVPARGGPAEHDGGLSGRERRRGRAGTASAGLSGAGAAGHQHGAAGTPALATPAAVRGRGSTPRTDDGDPALVAPSPFVSDQELRAMTGKPCRDCGLDRFEDEFSRTQWRKRIGDGVCRECMDARRQGGRSTSVQPTRGRAPAAAGRAERAAAAPERRGRSVGPALGRAQRAQVPQAQGVGGGGAAAAAAASSACPNADSDSEAEFAKPVRSGVASGQPRRGAGAAQPVRHE